MSRDSFPVKGYDNQNFYSDYLLSAELAECELYLQTNTQFNICEGEKSFQF